MHSTCTTTCYGSTFERRRGKQSPETHAKPSKIAVRRGAAHEVGGGMAWPYLCGRVLPLPIGDWVQGCVSRLQAALRAWPNTLDIKVVAQGEDSTEKASGTARACRGAFTSDSY